MGENMKRILSIFLLSFALLFPNISRATINWANNATSLIADSGGITAGATSVTVTTGEGDKFPAVASPHYFMITFVDVSANREIVKVTARASGSNTMTIVRGQEGTSPRAFAEGSLVDLRITAGSLDAFSEIVDMYSPYYVCDASAADQADVVNSNSLASLTGSIGTSLNATIILPHSGTGNTTAYNVLQNLDLSSYDNITFIIERGSIITHAANTIDMVIPQAGSYQIFSGTGAITLNNPGASNPIVPQWWGATGDGVTDDTTAIQNAATASYGNRLYFSHGTYIASTITFTGDIEIFGNGVQSIIKQKDSTVGHLFTSTVGATQIHIHDLYFDGNESNQAAQSTNYIINMSGAGSGVTDPSLLIVDRCTFINQCYSSVYLKGDNVSTTVERLIVRDSQFFTGKDGVDVTYDPRYVNIANAGYGLVTGNHFDYGSTPSVTGISAIVINQTQTATAYYTRYTITDNTFRRLGRNATNTLGVVDFYIWGKNLIIAKNRFEDSNYGAIRGKSDADQTIIANNNIHTVNNAGSGIIITGSVNDALLSNKKFIISNNIIDGVTGYGISVDGSTNGDAELLIIAKNIIHNATGASYSALLVQQTDNGIIRDNIIFNDSSNGLHGVIIEDCNGMWKIDGNLIRNFDSYGIHQKGAGASLDLTVNDNIIQNPTRGGIFISVAKAAKLADNIIRDVTLDVNQWGIVISDSGETITTGIVQNNTVLGAVASGAFSKLGTVTTLYENDNTWNNATTAKGADAVGTNVFSANANALGANTGFFAKALTDGSIVYIPYWTDITP
jgi:hypothetical protein